MAGAGLSHSRLCPYCPAEDSSLARAQKSLWKGGVMSNDGEMGC